MSGIPNPYSSRIFAHRPFHVFLHTDLLSSRIFAHRPRTRSSAFYPHVFLHTDQGPNILTYFCTQTFYPILPHVFLQHTILTFFCTQTKDLNSHVFFAHTKSSSRIFCTQTRGPKSFPVTKAFRNALVTGKRSILIQKTPTRVGVFCN